MASTDNREGQFAQGKMNLPPALAAESLFFTFQNNIRVHYYASEVDGTRPLILLHSINAAPSAFEIKPIFEYYQGKRSVYAIELPGFARSDRGDYDYTPDFFAASIAAFLQHLQVSQADMVAMSLSCEFTGLAVAKNPENIRKLVFISPTGLSQKISLSIGPAKRIYRVMKVLLRDTIFHLLTSKPSISWFYRKSMEKPVPSEMIDYAYATTHQPNARLAPFAFLSGKLFTQNADKKIYAQIKQPVLVIYDRDPHQDLQKVESFVAQHENWQTTRIQPTLGMPQWDEPERTFSVLDDYLQE